MNVTYRRTSWWILAVAMGASGGPLGCSAYGTVAQEIERVGSLHVALTGTGSSGVQYHLANATFAITGATNVRLSGNDPILRQDLPAGDYSIELADGWSLMTPGTNATESPVPAVLVSANPQTFTVRSQQITHTSFDFQIQGETITMGEGELSVALHVSDGLIDDFEDGNSQIAPVAGRNGFWFEFTDGTNGVLTPALGAPVLPVPDGPNGNLVLHVTGGGFTGFGAGVGATLLTGNPAPVYNAAAYAGVRFKYSSASWVRFAVGTVATTTTALGGSCDPALSVCFDAFGSFLPPTQDFTEVTIPWGQLSQQGFGKVVAFDASQLQTVQWNFQGAPFGPPVSVGSFDLRLDDVSFIPL